MTPHETALRLMRRRGTSTGEPEFVVAYLTAELELDPHAFETDAERGMRRLAEASGRAGDRMDAVVSAIAAMSSAWTDPDLKATVSR